MENTPSKQIPKARCLLIARDETKSMELQMAESGVSPVITNANTLTAFVDTTVGSAVPITECVEVLNAQVRAVKDGNMEGIEATLTAQIAALNAIFNRMALQAHMNIGEHMRATETYLRLALKAQTQCRATAETLAFIKNPLSGAYIRQANINNRGQQQVNNGTTADPRAREIETEQNKLLGVATNGTMDGGATQATGGVNSQVEAVGAIDRTKDSRGARSGQSERLQRRNATGDTSLT